MSWTLYYLGSANYDDFCYGHIECLGTLFSTVLLAVYMVHYAVTCTQNRSQFGLATFCYITTNATIYASIRCAHHDVLLCEDGGGGSTTVTLGVLGSLQILLLGLFMPLKRVFRWYTYQEIGSQTEAIDRFKAEQRAVAVNVADLSVFLSMELLYLFAAVPNTPRVTISSLALALALGFSGYVHMLVRREAHASTGTILQLAWLQPLLALGVCMDVLSQRLSVDTWADQIQLLVSAAVVLCVRMALVVVLLRWRSKLIDGDERRSLLPPPASTSSSVDSTAPAIRPGVGSE